MYAGVVEGVLGALTAHSGRTGATDPRFEATRGVRVRGDFDEGVLGVLVECLGRAGGDEVLRVRLGYVSN